MADLYTLGCVAVVMIVRLAESCVCCGDGQRAVCLVLCCVVVVCCGDGHWAVCVVVVCVVWTVRGLCVLWWYVLWGLSEGCLCCGDGLRAVCVVVIVRGLCVLW